MIINPDTKQKLIQHIMQVEQIQNDLKDSREFLAQKFAEIKGDGFDSKVIKKIIKARQDLQKFHEEQEIFETYLMALGESN